MSQTRSPSFSMMHTVIAVVTAIFLSEFVTDEMGGEPLLLRALARAIAVTLLVLLYFFVLSRLKRG